MKLHSIASLCMLLAASIFVLGCETADDANGTGVEPPQDADTTTMGDPGELGEADDQGDDEGGGASIFDELGNTDETAGSGTSATDGTDLIGDDSGSGTGGGIDTPFGFGDDSGSGTGGGVDTP